MSGRSVWALQWRSEGEPLLTPIQIGREYFIVHVKPNMYFNQERSVSKVNEYKLAEWESLSTVNTTDSEVINSS